MNSKMIAVFTALFGIATTLAGLFSTEIQTFVIHHPSIALVSVGIVKILSSFNSATPTAKTI